MSLDVVLHLRDRSKLFYEVRGYYGPAEGFCLPMLEWSPVLSRTKRYANAAFTAIPSSLPQGGTNICSNLRGSGCRDRDRIMSVLKNASGRLAAMRVNRQELERVSSAADVASQEDYLETVVELSRRGAYRE